MKIAIADIVVEPGRFRGATGNMKALSESLTRFGQLVPIIVQPNGAKVNLVAGFRRYTAAKSLGWTHLDGVLKDDISELLKKEIELEENLQREDMTWQEEVSAIATLDALKKQLDPNWSQIQTGAAIGMERSHVNEAVRLTKLMELFPELKDAKSVTQALSWASSKAQSVVRRKEVRDNPSQFQEIEEKVWLDDSIEAIKRVPEGSIDLILTDPPFGIGYDRRKAGEASASAYQDDEKSYQRILSMAPDLYRVGKPNSWLVWFLGPTWYERAKSAFREAGWTVDEMPLVWVRTAGRCYTARPDRYFARGYDIALHALKGNPEMVIRNRPNVFEFAPVTDKEQTLLVERPVELYAEIIKHLTHPGERVADFFVGSGSSLAAAASLGREFFGCEIDPERRAVAIKKIESHLPDGS
jgi:site-specific DNA-methyltransferase (adenine-specific)